MYNQSLTGKYRQATPFGGLIIMNIGIQRAQVPKLTVQSEELILKLSMI